MMKLLDISMQKKFRNKHPGLALLCKDVVNICKGNTEYIEQQLSWEYDPSIVNFSHPGYRKNEKPVLHIIPDGGGCGFFGEFRAVLSNLLYAEWFGLEPIVEWNTDFLYWDKDMSKLVEDPFEYYFEPIGDKKRLTSSFNVATKKMRNAELVYLQYHDSDKGYEGSDAYISELARINKKYIKVKPELKNSIEAGFKDIAGIGKTLGVHYRGTDYNVGYIDHPKQVSLQQYLEVIQNAISQHSFDKIFLATDQKGVYEFFKDNISIPVVRYEDVTRGDGNVSIAFSEDERKYHKYLLGKEVMKDMLSLSLCDGIVAGTSQVATVARIFRKSSGTPYVVEKIIDNGINETGKIFRIDK